MYSFPEGTLNAYIIFMYYSPLGKFTACVGSICTQERVSVAVEIVEQVLCWPTRKLQSIFEFFIIYETLKPFNSWTTIVSFPLCSSRQYKQLKLVL